MTKKDSDRTEALLEDVNSKFDTMMEYIVDIPKIKQRVDANTEDIKYIREKLDITFEETGRLREDTTEVKEDITEIKSDILDVKADIKGMKGEISDVKSQLDTLEKAMKLLGWDTKEVKDLQQRVEKLEKAAA